MLAVLLALGVPAQAVIGGITVLTDLNPWIVSFHLMFSLAMVSVAVLYVWRTDRPAPAQHDRSAPADRARLDVVRRGMGGALPGHRGDRLGPARR